MFADFRTRFKGTLARLFGIELKSIARLYVRNISVKKLD